MKHGSMNRKEFLANVGKTCVGACVCAMVGDIGQVHAEEASQAPVKPAEAPRSEARMKFAEGWVTRFLV